MGKKKETDPPALQKYGVPLYSAAWLPLQFRHEDHDSSKQHEQDKDREEITHASASSYEYYVVLAGGGGEGRSGIPNAVLLSRFDFSSNSLSPQPVAKLNLGSDLPYRMVVHPGGDGLICALPNRCRDFHTPPLVSFIPPTLAPNPLSMIPDGMRNENIKLGPVMGMLWKVAQMALGKHNFIVAQVQNMLSTFKCRITYSSYVDVDLPTDDCLKSTLLIVILNVTASLALYFEWDEVEDNEDHKLGLKSSEKVLTQLEDVGQQLALVFNSDSSVLAVGGEDGNLRVFKWPSMEIIFNEAQAHASLKDLCFSPDGKFLVSLGGRGPGRVWDVTSSMAVASLSKENDEIFAFCRFSQISDQTQVLYVAAITDKGSSIVTWNASSWKRVSSKHVFREPVSSFNISPDGKFLAIGTAQGDVMLINSTNMCIQTMIKKAHLGIVTALTFSHDSRALVSASMDSSARVTLVEDKKRGMYIEIQIFLPVIGGSAMAALWTW
ncbi:hypothetical protein POTOM_029997 [Populus tomentosa]|uniref:Transducin/WD40 repeat-like superfamily protein n=1 Tax=Populus tomentosa TaxID=118781 RepID=A0A8X8CK54_POPTO|nr:hypothetical protein POTOM_029997 [Populus tomentosa]